MLNQLIMAFLCVFSIIGIASVIYGLVGALSPKSSCLDDFKLILVSKNRESDIEGIIRTLHTSILSTPLCECEIIFVDTGSDDETPLIIKKLSNDIGGIEYYTVDEYLNHIKKQ